MRAFIIAFLMVFTGQAQAELASHLQSVIGLTEGVLGGHPQQESKYTASASTNEEYEEFKRQFYSDKDRNWKPGSDGDYIDNFMAQNIKTTIPMKQCRLQESYTARVNIRLPGVSTASTMLVGSRSFKFNTEVKVENDPKEKSKDENGNLRSQRVSLSFVPSHRQYGYMQLDLTDLPHSDPWKEWASQMKGTSISGLFPDASYPREFTAYVDSIITRLSTSKYEAKDYAFARNNTLCQPIGSKDPKNQANPFALCRQVEILCR